jgi:SGNH hydrolase-like domain, acetyltransferase AlgX
MPDASDMFAARQATAGGIRTIAPRRAERQLSWAFLGLVSLWLVTPLFQTLYPRLFGTLVRPLEERRAPAALPPLHLLSGTGGDFAAGLNKWFDDRAGFRDLFIRSKNQIDYGLFHTSRKVYVGLDGWLFSRDEGFAVESLDAAGLSALEESYVALARRLRDKGVQLIVVGYPRKSAIYPEMAPPDMPMAPAGGNYDRFRQLLAKRSDLTFIDAGEIIRREKSTTSELLYYKDDMHATEFGQLPVVKEIVAHIARTQGRPDIRWDEKFEPVHKRRSSGSETRFMSLLFERPVDYPDFPGAYNVGDGEPDGQWVMTDRRVLERADDGIGRPFDFEFRSRPEFCRERLPGTVLFGNSFSDLYWRLGFHRYFCSVRRARNPIGRFNLFYETMPADTKYFIFQYYEPWMVQDMPPLE